MHSAVAAPWGFSRASGLLLLLATLQSGCAHSSRHDATVEVASVAGLSVVDRTEEYRRSRGLEVVGVSVLGSLEVSYRSFVDGVSLRMLRADDAFCDARPGRERSCPRQDGQAGLGVRIHAPVWQTLRDAIVRVQIFEGNAASSTLEVTVSRSDQGDWIPTLTRCEYDAPCEIPLDPR